MTQNYPSSSRGEQRSNDPLVSKIKSLPRMNNLKAEDFAMPGGLADCFAEKMKKDLKATQLRRFFHEIKDLKLEFKVTGFNRSRIAMLMPMLAYAKGRGVIPQIGRAHV